ncbi:MAG: response regulator transcription factor [Chloroflexi bacterium]|nr:response regulator transcription factor [Chloroflexota bacterium]
MIVDDHEMVRSGLATFLAAFNDLELVGEAADGETAVHLVREVDPHVVLMDLMMPHMNGKDAISEIRRVDPAVQVIALTSFCNETLVQEALEAGAIGYLMKDTSIDELAVAIRAARVGKATLAPEALHHLISLKTRKPPAGSQLSDREREVLACIADGMTNSEIAERLVISYATVKTHVSNIISKLEVSNRIEAATLAVKQGLVDRTAGE